MNFVTIHYKEKRLSVRRLQKNAQILQSHSLAKSWGGSTVETLHAFTIQTMFPNGKKLTTINISFIFARKIAGINGYKNRRLWDVGHPRSSQALRLQAPHHSPWTIKRKCLLEAQGCQKSPTEYRPRKMDVSRQSCQRKSPVHLWTNHGRKRLWGERHVSAFVVHLALFLDFL